jgi:uncharacterized protein (TIGR03000 family)
MAALALLGVLWTSDRAAAQYSYQPAPFQFQSSIDNPDTYGAYSMGPGFFFTGGASADAPEEQIAYIHVRVSPPHAEISFQGSKTTQIGRSRLYTSPPLVQGKGYTYDIRVTWKENGKEIVQDRTIPVRAGDRLSVVFRAPAAAAGTATLQTNPGTQQ